MVAQVKTGMSTKITKQLPNKTQARFAKTDARYWLSRIRKPVNSRGEASPHWHLQLTFKGRRLSFSLHTGNKDAAARQAAGIYKELAAVGAEETLSRYRPKEQEEEPPSQIATVGLWIETVGKVFAGAPATFGSYARCLRLIVGDILAVTKTKKRFSRSKGNAYRAAVNAAPLGILTPKALQEWRIRFVAKAGTNPAEQRTAKISCNSILRQAGALFSKKLLRFVSNLQLPSPIPFAECEKYPRESMRYHSKVDAAALLQKAQGELGTSDPEAFKVLLLGVGVGLRRGEIDKLLWRQIDLNSGVIRIETTEAGSLKSEDSAGEVQMDEALCAIFRGYLARATGDFVLERDGGTSGVRDWGRQYRCNSIFKRTLSWLRRNGLDVKKPIHTLRKEAGSMISTKSGIHAASRFLRHADIQVTAMHYTDHKERVAVDIGGMLQPENVTVITTPRKTSTTMEAVEKPPQFEIAG
jgi:integrase